MNKILMVDKEITMLHKSLQRLSKAGFEMLSAFDGHHGYQLARNQSPDLIIADATSPVMNGYELCKAIKDNLSTQSIPIVVTTERHRMEDSFVFLGIKDFLDRPLDLDELEKIVKNKLSSSQNTQQLKTKILIYGRPEVLSCCEKLLDATSHWNGYCCSDSDSLLRDAIKYAPGVILLDLLMPGVSADALIHKLKMVPELKNTTILTYYTSTSTSRDPFAIQAQIIEVQYMKRVTEEAGAKEYIGPFNPANFLHLIDVYRRSFNFII